MATITNNTILVTNNTDADFRAWVQFYNDAFNLAWIQTGDSGQINISTATKPAAANTAVGYQVWRMNDSLQSTKPVFIKVEYGSGSLVLNPALWVTIGTGSNGAGGITGVLFARTQLAAGNNNASTLNKCFAGVSTNRITIATFLDQNQAFIWLAIERTKVPGTTTGADNGDGLIFAYGVNGMPKSVVLPFTATAPTAEDGIQIILSRNNPTTYTGDQGIGLMIPMLGTAIQPGLNVCVVMAADFAAFAQPSFTLYGGPHVYQHMGGNIGALRVGAQDANTRLMLLYE